MIATIRDHLGHWAFGAYNGLLTVAGSVERFAFWIETDRRWQQGALNGARDFLPKMSAEGRHTLLAELQRQEAPAAAEAPRG